MMCSDKVRYYRAGGMIYVFYLAESVVQIYGFKPYHKRRKFRDPWLFHSSRHFYVISTRDLRIIDPSVYLGMCEPEWRELILGVSYL